MKFLLLVALACGSVTTNAQSCLTQDDVKQMITRVESSSQSSPNKGLKEELLKIAIEQRKLLLELVDKDQVKASHQNKLHKLYEVNSNKLCQILKTNGWPTTASVDHEGIVAA